MSSYVRTPENTAWSREPWTCPKCGMLGVRAGNATHLKHCEPPEVKFWRNVVKGDGCWIYAKSAKPDGYRFFRYRDAGEGAKQIQWYAHRFSWAIANGPIPNGMEVAHRCDNRGCVRPDHLFLATHDENMADCKAKRRTCWGERSVKTTLTDEKALEILALKGTAPATEVAPQFGVSPSTVGSIWRRDSWAYLPAPLPQKRPHE